MKKLFVATMLATVFAASAAFAPEFPEATEDTVQSLEGTVQSPEGTVQSVDPAGNTWNDAGPGGDSGS